MNKKMIMIVGILGVMLLSPFHAAAKSPDAGEQPGNSGPIEISGNRATVLLSDIGYRGRTLISPYDQTSAVFSAPITWKLVPGSLFELQYDLLVSGTDVERLFGGADPYGGDVTVTFNGQIIGTIPLSEPGSHTVQFELPPNALTSIRTDGRHQLAILLDARSNCDYAVNARFVVKTTSFFELVFEESSPELNLSRLPAPFYRANSFLPENALIVVPDAPSALELQAAMNVMSGFGSMIGAAYNMELITTSQLSTLDSAQYHIVFIGTPEHLSVLSGADLQVPISDGSLGNLPPASQGDGVVQLALSPWNPNKVILVITGNTDTAVSMAAQAVSSGRVFVFENPALAFVSNVQLLSDTLPVVEDFTFENLGYVTEVLSGFGTHSQDYVFYASKEQIVTREAYLDLAYYHSGLQDYESTTYSVSIELNGQLIASTPFSEESEQIATLHVGIPPGTLRFGENRLTINTSLAALPSCDVSGFSDPWLTITNQSKIHLPAVTGAIVTEPLLKDLRFFPDLFVTRSDLGDIAFIFPDTDVASWKIAGRLAYELGRSFNPLISNLRVAFADNVPESIYGSRSMVILGLASELPFLSEFNELLPAPFDPSTNMASERQMQVVYRVPDGVSVGYLELMLSPFNAERSILVISGNTRDGVLLAGDGLLVGTLKSQLAGVFAVTNGKQIASGSASSPFSIVDDVVPGAIPINTTPIPDIFDMIPSSEPPPWLTPALAGSTLIILVVLGSVAASALAKRRQERIKILNTDKQPARPDKDSK